MKYIAFFIAIAILSSFAKAQDRYNISIDEVSITASKSVIFDDDKQIISFDSVQIGEYSGNSISQLLANETNINIKSYGINSLSTISLRGTSANQTTVLWNGIKINSITTGNADLSLIQVSGVEKISVVKGASATFYGSGTFGGAIEINNKPVFRQKTFFAEKTFITQYGGIGSNIEIEKSGRRVAWNFSAIKTDDNGEFRYKDVYLYEQPILTIKHNAANSIAIINYLSYRTKNNIVLESGIRAAKKYKQIPATMGSFKQSSAVQSDTTLNTYINIYKIFQKARFDAKFAYSCDFLHFTDKLNPQDSVFSINSVIISHRIISSAFMQYYFTDNFLLKMSVDNTKNIADVATYRNKIIENTSFFSLAIKYAKNDYLFNAGLAYDYNNKLKTEPVFSLAISRLSDYIDLKASFARKYRVPSFNDRYWQPGGNPNLLPESGFNTELGFNVNKLNYKKMSTTFGADFYYSIIENYIQWVPVSAFWEARNVKKVAIKGADFYLKSEIRTGNSRINTNLYYSYTNSIVVQDYSGDTLTLRKQLPYIPVHSANIVVKFYHKNFSFRINQRFEGKRQTTADNMEVFALPPYYLCSVSLRYLFKMYRTKISPEISVNNVFNSDYQLIRAYPQPRRMFIFSVKIMFNNNFKTIEK